MKERLPIVALVGRPNVGKSRLFNRFVRERRALVENTPGVTRDRNYGHAEWNGSRFTVIDTGGFEPDSNDVLLEQMRDQARLAVEEADVIIFVTDARAGLLPADSQIADILRRSNRRVILAVNKIDKHSLEYLSYEFYELAFGEMFAISAEHGIGFDDLVDAVTRDFPKNAKEGKAGRADRFVPDDDFELPDEVADIVDGEDVGGDGAEAVGDDADGGAGGEGDIPLTEEDAGLYEVPSVQRESAEELAERVLQDTICVAVLGKPNTGKSTLINRLLGYTRLLTADIAGTTRDTIDSEIEGRDGQQYILIDTAGIRKKSAISQKIEKFSIVKALDAVERADVVLLVVDVRNGVTEQDLKIAAIAVERGCAVAVLLNKWDTIPDKTDQTAKEHIKAARERLAFVEGVPIFTISALDGTRTHKVLDIAKKLYMTASTRVPTGELNRVFKRVLEHHTPPTVGSRNLKFYYAQQVAVRPPTFVIQSNAPEIIPTDYKRYITNQIRAYYGFEGTPIRVIFRKPAGRRRWEKKGR